MPSWRWFTVGISRRGKYQIRREFFHTAWMFPTVYYIADSMQQRMDGFLSFYRGNSYIYGPWSDPNKIAWGKRCDREWEAENAKPWMFEDRNLSWGRFNYAQPGPTYGLQPLETENTD